MRWPAHGANPHYLTEARNLRPVAYDFSVNVNPLGPPRWLKEEWNDYFSLVTQYPDPANKQLIEILAEVEGVDSRHLLVGNGASELLQLIGRHFAGQKIVIVEPTFSEYRMIGHTFGCEIESAFLTEEEDWELPVKRIVEKAEEADLVVICNPNNPTGVHYEVNDLLLLLQEIEAYLLVDEAFYDFVEEEPTLLSYVEKYSNLLVLRSLTKMYAIPGIRVGYLTAGREIIESIAPFQPTWSVNGVAQVVAERCVRDERFRFKTRQFVQSERKRIFPKINDLGFSITNTSVNYYLLGGCSKLGETLLPYLLENGIAARHTYNFPRINGDSLRLCINTKEANDVLVEKLAGWRA
ncbi:histidinol-phosphate transaminase [Halobacillus sp. Marseille-P3879]|uniref:pyridoxal phosphate-dependent aminotransferase n=1 Tax=Halobacillus sp. Marseille-P3879 TaxID=2045014 RepID=UPI0013588040|nr:aminotransferase class I/II-fold pyridoxal phosphate-dependent enzyme [Halobacillus sp. Marseille-P3879]